MTPKPVHAPDSTSPHSSNSPEKHHNQSWQDLAQQACQETDPGKLMSIVKDLCTAIDEDGKPGSQKPADASERASHNSPDPKP